MTNRQLLRGATLLSAFIILLMAILRNTQSEVFTMLSVSLGGVIFYTLLYYLFRTEKIDPETSNPHLRYLFFGVSIPLLVVGVDATSDLGEGLLYQSVRIALCIVVLYLIFYWTFKYRRRIQKLKQDKLKAELTLLKNQINPHFFFNTLNKLYSLIGNDAKAAQEYVLKLSDLMRFTIYDSGKESVLLKEEANYLANFIDLQTARYHKDIDVHFVKSITNHDATVAPLLFVILLENAFKHGVENVIEDAFIHIELIEKDYNVSFTIKNSFGHHQPSEQGGIGLKNLRDRLNLLYPNAHDFTCGVHDDIYIATLEIHGK